jgi:hypothetical protein
MMPKSFSGSLLYCFFIESRQQTTTDASRCEMSFFFNGHIAGIHAQRRRTERQIIFSCLTAWEND